MKDKMGVEVGYKKGRNLKNIKQSINKVMYF